MRPLATVVSAAAVPLLIAGGRGMAQDRMTPRRAVTAEASVGADWLDVRFPKIALANTGCGYTEVQSDGLRQRWYQWQVIADFGDRAYPNNHFMAIDVLFRLPDSLPLTDGLLDSALAATRITVDEAAGEPPMTGRQTQPARAWARREAGRLHMRVEGRAAIESFKRARADSVTVGWCQRDESLSFVRVPLRKR